MQLPGALILAAGFGIAFPILGLVLRTSQKPENLSVPVHPCAAENRHVERSETSGLYDNRSQILREDAQDDDLWERQKCSAKSNGGGYTNFFLFALLTLIIILAVVRPVSHWPGKIIYGLIAVGFGEEFFFRGYLQSRLNQAFGRPYRWWNVSFGWGLILTSALFALAHGFNPHGNFYWSIWTFPLGLIFGRLREQTGGILASALVHGTAVTVPLVVL